MKAMYRIDTGYACAGILTDDDVVYYAAPIFRWMTGKSIEEVKRWKKIKSIEKLEVNNGK